MSANRSAIGSSPAAAIPNLSEISADRTFNLSIDLVTAARKHIAFLRNIAEIEWLHTRSAVVEAIRRYDKLWMPLFSDLTIGSTPPMVLPPIDVQWIWYCHTLNPVSYREYCESRFSKLLGKPAIFNNENEEYALNRGRDFWNHKYPFEPFENELDSDMEDAVGTNEDLMGQVLKQSNISSKFMEPFMSEVVYLIAARERYKSFLILVQKFADGHSRLVPTVDVLLMWLSHQSYPTVYAEDVKEIERAMGKVVCVWERVNEWEVELTKTLWETTFNLPYEKSGGGVALEMDGVVSVKPPLHCEVYDVDVNTRYKSMLPRLLLEVCVFPKLNSKTKAAESDTTRDFLRLRTVRCHRMLKMDKSISSIPSDSWRKAWHLYCEFSTKGVVLELCSRGRGGPCFKGTTILDTIPILWNDLLRVPSLTLERELNQRARIVTSITPPIQAPYLLKCVPDRVTDDSGAMISDVILKMNQYRPQAGRWLSRTVLDHAGRECFVVRIRIGGGFWRRGGETPTIVKWEDRIIEIREGSWSYIVGSIGRAPGKVVGTATPKGESREKNASWHFSTGDVLTIQWESSTSSAGLSFHLNSNSSPDSSVELSKGRKMQYSRRIVSPNKELKEGDDDNDNEGFVTLIRFSDENPNGRATALLNWKLLVIEIAPEEDAVLMMLICISILRTISDIRKEDVGGLLVRRRLKEEKLGVRDWGSVTLAHSLASSDASPFLQPWYWNAKAVMVANDAKRVSRQPALNYSHEEGGDNLYKRGIIT